MTIHSKKLCIYNVHGNVSITIIYTSNHNCMGTFLSFFLYLKIFLPLALLEVLSIGTVLVALYSLFQDLAAL